VSIAWRVLWRGDGALRHRGSPTERVPALVAKLLAWIWLIRMPSLTTMLAVQNSL